MPTCCTKNNEYNEVLYRYDGFVYGLADSDSDRDGAENRNGRGSMV